jgi:hypothetical protein
MLQSLTVPTFSVLASTRSRPVHPQTFPTPETSVRRTRAIVDNADRRPFGYGAEA